MAKPTMAGAITSSYNSVTGGIDVNVQSQTSPLFKYLLMHNIKTDITLTAPVAIDDTTINVSAGHGFTAVAGERIVMRNGDAFIQQKVISVSTNELTIEMPIDMAFPILGTTVIRGNVDMNINGSVTPQNFEFLAKQSSTATIPIDIGSVVVTMQSGATVPDDGTFGGIALLTNGMYVRKINGIIYNIGNYRSNQDFKAVGATVEYSSKAPAGTNGTNIYFNIEQIYGQVIRLDPKTDDSLVVNVRDDLRGLAGMRISIIGSLTRGE